MPPPVLQYDVLEFPFPNLVPGNDTNVLLLDLYNSFESTRFLSGYWRYVLFWTLDRDSTNAYPCVTPKLSTSRSTARVIHQQTSSAIPGDCTQKPSSYIRNESLCKWMKTLLQLSAVSDGGKRGWGTGIKTCHS